MAWSARVLLILTTTDMHVLSVNQRFPYKLAAADCLAHFHPEVISIALRAVLLNSEAVA